LKKRRKWHEGKRSGREEKRCNKAHHSSSLAFLRRARAPNWEMVHLLFGRARLEAGDRERLHRRDVLCVMRFELFDFFAQVRDFVSSFAELREQGFDLTASLYK